MFKKIWNGIKKVVKDIVRVVRAVVGGTVMVGGLTVACVGGLVTTKPVLDSVFKVVDYLAGNIEKAKENTSDENDISDTNNTKEEDATNV